MKPKPTEPTEPPEAASATTEDEPSARVEAPSMLDELAVATPSGAEPRPVAAVRTARLVELVGIDAVVVFRGSDERVRALVSSDVEPELLREAFAERAPVLVEDDGRGAPVVVGLLQTRRPREVVLGGERVEIRADREILLRTGRAGIRLRDDGELELVGTRVSALSRGVFRIVGKMLRLN